MRRGDKIKSRVMLFAILIRIEDDQLLSLLSGWPQEFQGRHGFKQLSSHGQSAFVSSMGMCNPTPSGSARNIWHRQKETALLPRTP